MSSPALPLSDIVDVIVQVAPQAPALPTFNVGLVLGNSAHIPSWGAGSYRIRKYTSLAQMSADGFLNTDPEYIAMSLYFSQQPPPQSGYVGRVDQTGTSIVTLGVGSPGTGYKVGDKLSISGGTGGVGIVTSVGGSGAVTGIAILQDGTGYSAGTDVTTDTTGSGAGCTVTVTVGNETILEALQYCLALQSAAFYGVYGCGAVDSDILALAGFVQTSNPPLLYFYTTSDSDVLNNNANNICSQLSALSYSRAIGDYSTTQGGNAPNNAYSGAAAMGMVCGRNTGLANSYFTAKFKTLVGVTAEPITETQKSNLNTVHCNYYVNYQNAYTFFGEGYVANGSYIDQIIQRDMLAVDIQFTVMNLLVGSPAIPQTDAGQALLIHGVSQAADRAVTRGYIPSAGGTWNGVQIVNLQSGDALPKGYLAQSYPYSQQSQADRAARKGQPIYLAVLEAGAIHSIVIGVYVQA